MQPLSTQLCVSLLVLPSRALTAVPVVAAFCYLGTEFRDIFGHSEVGLITGTTLTHTTRRTTQPLACSLRSPRCSRPSRVRCCLCQVTCLSSLNLPV